ncbi:glycosyltransferase family 1 protein [Cytophagales bacterium RKSG123]|nr:glycosyltransferase family 1 protein [Xanthovirga aplysinae]
MRVGIIGTRGIPNYYGGFEQFAANISVYLVNKGHEVYVYNSSNHPYKEAEWKGVRLIYKPDPEKRIGTFGMFIYDLNCILDAKKRDFDVILQLGYTSSSIWGWLMPENSVVVTNMDGLEWKRTKYNFGVRKFLKFAESLAVKWSDYLVADSKGIREYLKKTYRVGAEFIPYGAKVFNSPDASFLKELDLVPFNYNMLVARLEPENNTSLILEGVVKAKKCDSPFLVIGNWKTKYGKYLKRKFSSDKIKFLGGIYDLEKLNNLRYYSNIYFHGHSVGGTNPSLLEAMACRSFICAHDNPFNRGVLGTDSYYFSSYAEVIYLLENVQKKSESRIIKNNVRKVNEYYSWEKINAQYENFMENCLTLVKG